jgi:hypothetical protein
MLAVVAATSSCGGRVNSSARTSSPGQRSAKHPWALRVHLTRSWTPEALLSATKLVEGESAANVAVVQRPDGRRGWWAVWSDTSRSQKKQLFDVWTAELVARLYRDRRTRSSPRLTGIALATPDPKRAPGLAGGELVRLWPPPSTVYLQQTASQLVPRIRARAARIGLRLEQFRMPRLDGIAAPIVVVRVVNEHAFAHAFDPGCLPVWVVGNPNVDPVGASGPAPFFGYYFTLLSTTGAWLQTTAFVPYTTDTQLSPTAAAIERNIPRHPTCARVPR